MDVVLTKKVRTEKIAILKQPETHFETKREKGVERGSRPTTPLVTTFLGNSSIV